MRDGTDTVLHVESAEPSQVRATESRSSKPQLPALAGRALGTPARQCLHLPSALRPLPSRPSSATLPLSPSRGHLALRPRSGRMPAVALARPGTVASCLGSDTGEDREAEGVLRRGVQSRPVRPQVGVPEGCHPTGTSVGCAPCCWPACCWGCWGCWPSCWPVSAQALRGEGLWNGTPWAVPLVSQGSSPFEPPRLPVFRAAGCTPVWSLLSSAAHQGPHRHWHPLHSHHPLSGTEDPYRAARGEPEPHTPGL